jgi:DNA-binding SARP family transcriptional activator
VEKEGEMAPDTRWRIGPASVEVAVLGPIAIHRPSGLEEVKGHRTRALLAALVVSVNHVVGSGQLIDIVWDNHPPRTAASTLQSHVSKLRRLLGEEAILHMGDGYLLSADCGQIDACVFERTLREAASCLDVDPDRARTLTRDALKLWRGTPYGDLADAEHIALEVRRLEDLRLTAIEVQLEADLAAGRVAEAVTILQGEVVEHPYHERLWYLLADGLAREGRRVEALRALRECERLLADLGLMPAPEFVQLEERIVAP